MTEQKHLKKYNTIVSKMMPRDYPKRDQLLADIRNMLSEYVKQHPEATYHELVKVHGAPEELITSLIDDLSSEEILRLFRKRQRRTVVVGLLAVFTAMIIALCIIRSSAINEPLDIVESKDFQSEEEHIFLQKGDK